MNLTCCRNPRDCLCGHKIKLQLRAEAGTSNPGHLQIDGEISFSDEFLRHWPPLGQACQELCPWNPPVALPEQNRKVPNQRRQKGKKCSEIADNDFSKHSTAWSYAGLRIPPAENAIYSTKVFIGGLPSQTTDKEIKSTFQKFGNMKIVWPKSENDITERIAKGYCFLTYDKEMSVRDLLRFANWQDDSYYVFIDSPGTRLHGKKVHVRPWKLEDAEYFAKNSSLIDEKKSVYVYGVPRPLTASKLALEMEKLCGVVSYVGLDVDSRELYPLCQARVSFKTETGYFQALEVGSILLQKSGTYKPSQIKPYVSQSSAALCEECSNYSQPKS